MKRYEDESLALFLTNPISVFEGSIIRTAVSHSPHGVTITVQENEHDIYTLTYATKAGGLEKITDKSPQEQSWAH